MPLTDNLISYWKLDETSGTRADAVVASANDLTDNNTVTGNPGKIAGAGQFTAANSEYLSRADNASLSVGSTDFTFSAWVYGDTIINGAGILGKWDVLGANAEYALLNLSNGGNQQFLFAVQDSSNNQTNVFATSFGTLSATTWYFVVAWYDSATQKINIQVNNGTVDQASQTTGVKDGTNNFLMGNYISNALSATMWNGRIDEVGFWKRVLTSDERTSLYNSGNALAYPFSTFMAPKPFIAKQAVNRASTY